MPLTMPAPLISLLKPRLTPMSPWLCPILVVGALLTPNPYSSASAQIVYDPPQPLDGIAVVVEGDRLLVNGLPVRLYGIDAPEIGQTCYSRRGAAYDCGSAARDILDRLIASRPVQCSIYSVLASAEQVGICSINGQDLAAVMVRLGWAFPARGLASRYESIEAKAQTSRSGVWSGRAERPWIWRRRQGLPETR